MNKKIKNATKMVYDNIHFKSKLEVSMYKLFKESNIEAKYEPLKLVLLEGFYPEIPWYSKGLPTKKKIINLTYTPDFVVYKEGIPIAYIELKGFMNDSYPLKRKILLHKLYSEKSPIVFFEVYTKRDMLSCIEKIKEM